jgi:hypothetical protein
MFIKIGEAYQIERIESTETSISQVDPAILAKFAETITEFKKESKADAEKRKVAPKADDFLYFSAIMMHAAEASSLNDDGTVKLTAKGEEVQVGWEVTGESMKWKSNDPSIKPYKNANADIFPEKELLIAHKKWVGKPLCIDHKSSSVDFVRGFIVDTYYDRKLKRVIALCALDKINYPDLARKVSTGYSNDVSMGTAVGKAVCTDCGRVARAEKDFCEHMRHKTCYGEINLDLSPIELSIVVNGADRKAKIKNIVASVNALNSYVAQKQNKLNKIANEYSANLSFNNKEGLSENISLNTNSLDELKADLEKAIERIEKLQEEMDSSDVDSSDAFTGDTEQLTTPGQRYAQETEISSAKEITAELSEKINMMQATLADLTTKISKITEEETMSKKTAYFQGTVDPVKGGTQYPADPMNAKLRDEDRQMKVDDLGGSTGLAPGDLEKKKLLARASQRLNALSAAKAALESRAYHAGTEAPVGKGKQQYKVDPGNEEARKGDKHMQGKKPFPEVGKVEDLYPGDKEIKQKLSRGEKLTGKFVKSAKVTDSAWKVFVGETLVREASVADLLDVDSSLSVDKIATAEFGKILLQEVRAQVTELPEMVVTPSTAKPVDPNLGKKLDEETDKVLKGLDTNKADTILPADVIVPNVLVAISQTGKMRRLTPAEAATAKEGTVLPDGSVVKSKPEDAVNMILGLPKLGQAAPEMTTAEPAAPVSPVVAPADVEDPTAKIEDISSQIQNLSSDLVEAVRALTGEQSEMGEIAAEPTAPVTATASLQVMRKQLNSGLVDAMKESLASLNDHSEELAQIVSVYENNAVTTENASVISSVTEDSIADAKTAIADGFQLLNAFVKYARSSDMIMKRAQMESELAETTESEDVSDEEAEALIAELLNDEVVTDEIKDDEVALSEIEAEQDAIESELADLDRAAADDCEACDEQDIKGDFNPTTNKLTLDLAQASDRATLRAKLASEFNPILNEAHPQGSAKLDLDITVSDDLDEVEDLEAIHTKVVDVATSNPNVRKEALAIRNLIATGSITASELDSLVAEGVDAAAVAYYKKYYANAEGGSEFAAELVKEHAKASQEAEMDAHKVKLAEAWELVEAMADRGLCLNVREAKAAQVDKILKFNAEGLESFKNIVAQAPTLTVKTAGFIPQVGTRGEGESTHAPVEDNDIVRVLSNSLGKKQRLF